MNVARLYVFSHSSLDMVSTLDQFETYARERQVTIVISSTTENLEFLRTCVPAAALRFMHFESRVGAGRGVRQFARQLRADRANLDRLVAEIQANPANEVIFHSQDDPHLGYVVARVAPTNRVTFIDSLETPRTPLRVRDMLSVIGLKNLAMLALMTFTFGAPYRLAGTRSYPLLCLKVSGLGVLRKPRAAGTAATLAKHRYRGAIEPGTVVVLYANPLGVSEDVHGAAYRTVLDRLKAHGLTIVAKVHPQSTVPSFFEEYAVRYVPKYVPFEFVDLEKVKAVIGLAGASLLCTGNLPTFSILDMVYERGSDHHRSAMGQLEQNPAIRFLRTKQDLDVALAALATPRVLERS